MNLCINCGRITKGKLPLCPKCISLHWQSKNRYAKPDIRFFRPKHDSTYIPWSMDSFRTVVPINFVTNQVLFSDTIAEYGDFYYNTKYFNFTCFLHKALGDVSGSAIPKHSPYPTYPVDSIKVYDALGPFPHIMAEDFNKFMTDISSGLLIPSTDPLFPIPPNLSNLPNH